MPSTKAALLILIQTFLLSIPATGQSSDSLTTGHVSAAEAIIGLQFTDAERDSLLETLRQRRSAYEKIRDFPLDNSTPPALIFNPLPLGMQPPQPAKSEVRFSLPTAVRLPENESELAFYSVGQLAELLRTRQITSVQLTEFFLRRLRTYGPELECVVTITDSLALAQARRADAEIAAGTYRGPLHGIPYGAKDLLALPGYKTTWGAAPYRDQELATTATVLKKLDEAGAVLVAKLTLGALAWGDVWFGGKTRNPWNREQGSSGSSAGSAAATAAGLVPFAIGTETWGSIVSPSNRCGVTGLRPTFGRVSRAGAMALSWSMDKIGPIARSVDDCAIVFDAIRGSDGIDQTVIDWPFTWDPEQDIRTIRVGYLKSAFERDYANKENDRRTLDVLRELGVELVAIELPEFPVYPLSFILSAEAAAAFDELTRSNRDDLLVRQIKNAWPNVFRAARFIPAVEYIQANRLRYLLIQAMQKVFEKIDVYVAPSFGGDNLLRTNLTGHPAVVIPNGFNKEGSPTSISFIGNLFEEGKVLAVARAVQRATDFHLKHPPGFD